MTSRSSLVDEFGLRGDRRKTEIADPGLLNALDGRWASGWEDASPPWTSSTATVRFRRIPVPTGDDHSGCRWYLCYGPIGTSRSCWPNAVSTLITSVKSCSYTT